MTESKAYVQNAADPKQVRDSRSKEERAREREIEDLRWLLGSRNGRRFFWRYLGLCGVMRSSFSESAALTAYQEGQRNVGLMLMRDLNEADPEAYLRMIAEFNSEKGITT